MPLYDYECSACNARLAVLRQMSEHDVPPSHEEEEGIGICCGHNVGEHNWVRKIGGNQTLLRGPNWNGAKGYW